MSYRFMRVILMFDLPVKTKKDRKIYHDFRKRLIREGYLMIQYSVYCKICSNRDSAQLIIDKIKREAPQKGNVRMCDD